MKQQRSPKNETSFKTKSTPEWYENFIDYYIDRAISSDVDRIAVILEQYDYLSHTIPDIKYKEVMSGLQKDLTPEKIKEFKAIRQDFNLVLRLVKKYVGEYITRYSSFQVYTEDDKAVTTRNDILASKITDMAFQKFVNGLNAQGTDTGIPTVEQPDIETLIEQETQTFLEEKALKAKARIELLKRLSDYTYKLSQLIYYYVATDNMISYIYNQGTDTFFDVVPPETFYCVPSNTGFTEDSPVVCRKYKMRLNHILERFEDILPGGAKKELERIVQDYEINGEDYTGKFNTMDVPGIISNRIDSTVRSTFELTDHHMLTTVYHVQAMSKKRIGILTYMDFETNQQHTDEVSEDYKLDVAMGDISLTWEYIDCFYEGWRFGNDSSISVYTKIKELDVQREHLNIKSLLKNSYYGVTNVLPNIPFLPLPGRLINYQIEYEIIRFRRKQIIAKFKPNTKVLPEGLLMDSQAFTLEERISKMLTDDQLIINDENLSPQQVSALQVTYRDSVEKYIDSLTNIMKSIESEALDEAEMNPVRYGNASPYMSNELATKQENYATIGNVLAISTYSQALINLMEAMIDYTKIAWIDGKRGMIQLPDNRLEEVIVDGIENFNDNVGIFVKDMATETQKLQQVKQMAFNASQNGDLQAMMELVMNDDMLSIKANLAKFNKANQDFQLQLESVKKEAEEIKRATQQEKFANEKDLLLIKEDGETRRANEKNRIDLLIANVKNMLTDDTNSNDANLNATNNLDFQKQKHRDDLDMKQKQITSNENIATRNKN